MSSENDVLYHVKESRVAHSNRDCQHLEKAHDENIETIPSEKGESYRKCHQCAIDDLSAAERRKRNQRSRRNTTTTVKIRR